VRGDPVHERLDHVSQRLRKIRKKCYRKREVDVLGLVEAGAGGLGLALALGPSQVNQVKLASPDLLLACPVLKGAINSKKYIRIFSRFNVNREYGMASGGIFVHGGLTYLAKLHAREEDLLQLRHGLYYHCSQILHVYALIGVFLDLQVLLTAFAEQIQDTLIVNF